MFLELDLDADGAIDYEEFLAAMIAPWMYFFKKVKKLEQKYECIVLEKSLKFIFKNLKLKKKESFNNLNFWF